MPARLKDRGARVNHYGHVKPSGMAVFVYTQTSVHGRYINSIESDNHIQRQRNAIHLRFGSCCGIFDNGRERVMNSNRTMRNPTVQSCTQST